MVYDAGRRELLLFGGRGGGSGDLGDTWVWSGSGWLQRANSGLSPQANAAAAYDGARGQVVLLGKGVAGESFDTSVWNGSRWQQLHLAVNPPARTHASMTYDAARQLIVLFGGSDSAGRALNDTWTWDGSAWTLRRPAQSPAALSSNAMAYDSARQNVVLFNGERGETWIWDGNQWTQQTTLARPPNAPDSVMVNDVARQRIVLYQGGSASTWEWDGEQWTRHDTDGNPGPRSGMAAAYDSARHVTITFGGTVDGAATNTQEFYDGTAWYRAVPANTPARGGGAAMTWDGINGRVMLFREGTWDWNGNSWDVLSPQGSPVTAPGSRMVFDEERRQVVLFGGIAGDETWIWNGADWQRQSPLTNPPARSDFALAYDGAHARVVLFGGKGLACDCLLGDTWTWDGRNWTEARPTASPAARYGAAMSQGPNGTVVLAGGLGFDAEFMDTWTWDGSNWTELKPNTRPALPHGPTSMAFDEARGVLVLLSGAQTWLWDGVDWSLETPANLPAARSGAALAYDPVHAQMVMFGGSGDPDGSSKFGDTWTFDGGPVVAPGPILFDWSRGMYVSDVQVRNPSTNDIAGPFAIVFRELTDGVEVKGAAGTYQGNSYLNVDVPVLAPGRSITVPVQFQAPFPTQIRFRTQTYRSLEP